MAWWSWRLKFTSPLEFLIFMHFENHQNDTRRKKDNIIKLINLDLDFDFL